MDGRMEGANFQPSEKTHLYFTPQKAVSAI